jgi:hypothetical protein
MKLRIRQSTMTGVYYLEEKRFLFWRIVASTMDKQTIFEKAKLYRLSGEDKIITEWEI